MIDATCRICLSDAPPLVPAPCACAAWMHTACLHQWLLMRPCAHRTRCEVCRSAYRCELPRRLDAAADADVDVDVDDAAPTLRVSVVRSGVVYPLHAYVESQLVDAR